MRYDVMAVETNGRIVLGGMITNAPGGVSGTGLARLMPDGTLDSSFGSGGVLALDTSFPISGLTLLSTGEIMAISHVFDFLPRTDVWRVTANGSEFQRWPGIFGQILWLKERTGGTFYGWGSLYRSAGQTMPTIQEIAADGSLGTRPALPPEMTSYPSGLNDLLIASNGDLVASFGGIVARLTPAAGLRWIRGIPDGSPRWARNSKTLFEDAAGGIVLGAAIRYTADGLPDTTGFRTPTTDLQRRSLALSDGRFLITGDFSTVADLSRPSVACLLGDGSIDLRFNPGAGITPRVTFTGLGEQPDGKMLLSGDFTEFEGQPVRRLIRLHPRNPGSEAATNAFYGPSILSGYEVGPPMLLQVTRAGDLDGTNILRIRAESGTAIEGWDFPTFDTNIVFKPGVRFLDIEIPVIADNEPEAEERFALRFEPLDPGVNYFTANPLTVQLFNVVGSIRFATDHMELTEGGPNDSHTSPYDPWYIPMIQTGSASYNISVEPITATPGRDYVTEPYPWGPIRFLSLDNTAVDGPRTVRLSINLTAGGALVLAPSNMVITIRDNDTAAGPGRGFARGSFTNAHLPILLAIKPQTDRAWIAAGAFGTVDGVARPGIARLTPEGVADDSFIPPQGIRNVTAIAVASDGKILVGGSFDGTLDPNRTGLIRLLENGAIDPLFQSPQPPCTSANVLGIVISQGDKPAVIWGSCQGGADIIQYSSEFVEETSWRYPQQLQLHDFQAGSDGSLLVVSQRIAYRLRRPDLWGDHYVSDLPPRTALVSSNVWVCDGAKIVRYDRGVVPRLAISNVVVDSRLFPITYASILMAMPQDRMFALVRSDTNLLSVFLDQSGNSLGGYVHSGQHTTIDTHFYAPVRNIRGEIALIVSSPTRPQPYWMLLSTNGAPANDIAFRRIVAQPDGHFSATLRGQAPQGYGIEFSEDLDVWSPVSESPEINWNQSLVLPDGGPNSRQRFYRVTAKEQ